MKHDHVVSALVRKYAEIKGKLKIAGKNTGHLRTDLAHVAAVLKMFRSDYEIATITTTRPKRPIRWGKRGLGWRTAIEILEHASAPMSASEIGLQVAQKLHVETAGESWRYLVILISENMHNAASKGIVREIGRLPRRWEIVR